MTRRKAVPAGQLSFLEEMLLGVPSEHTALPVSIILEETRTSPDEPSQPACGLSIGDDLSPIETNAAEITETDLFGFVFALSDQQTKEHWTHAPPRVLDRVEQTISPTITNARQTSMAQPSALDTNGNGLAAKTAQTHLVPQTALAPSAPSADTAQPFLQITSEWLLENHLVLLTQIVGAWNLFREREGMTVINEATASAQVLSKLADSLKGAHAFEEVKGALTQRLHNLSALAQRLYGSEPKEDKETVQQLVNGLLTGALQPEAEKDVPWIRVSVEAGVRKLLSGESQNIYFAIILSALQRPFREAVRHLLEADELPFFERVLAHAREKGYVKVMRETLQTLALERLTMQSAALAWQRAQSGGEEQKEILWRGRCGERTTVALAGRALVNQRVVEHPEYVLIVTFQCERVTNHHAIRLQDLEQAKRILWSQGYRAEGEAGYPIPEKATQLWNEYFDHREDGWWYGDAAGRVIVVHPNRGDKITWYTKLRRAAAKMRKWGYALRYTDDAFYFLPAGVDMVPEQEQAPAEPEEEEEREHEEEPEGEIEEESEGETKEDL